MAAVLLRYCPDLHWEGNIETEPLLLQLNTPDLFDQKYSKTVLQFKIINNDLFL